jgi:hypothetical protein
MGVHLPNSKIGHLPSGRGELSDPLASDSKLHHQLPTQLHLLGQTVLSVPLTMEEQGLVMVALHEGLQMEHRLEAHEERMEHGSSNRSY